jgi:hypothetical protein
MRKDLDKVNLTIYREGGSMAPAEHQANDFIPYPIDRVVGTMLDGTRARAAIEALLQRGVDPAHIARQESHQHAAR